MIDSVRKLFGYKFPRLGGYAFNLFFKVAPLSIRCELFPGIKMSLNFTDLTQQATFWQGNRFEYPTACVLRDWGDIAAFFDIGANYGFYSYYMLSNYSDLQVYAFEPNHDTYKLITGIKEENNLLKLHHFNMGLGSQIGEYDLHTGLGDSGHSTFLLNPELIGQSIGKVNIITFQQWLSDQQMALPKHPEWVAKIDVEGMEFDVLLGMKKALEVKAFKGIVIEVLEHTLALAGRKPEDIFNFMNTVGYKPIPATLLIQKYGYMKTANVFFVPI